MREIIRCRECGDLFGVEDWDPDHEYICDGCLDELALEWEEKHLYETQPPR